MNKPVIVLDYRAALFSKFGKNGKHKESSLGLGMTLCIGSDSRIPS